MPNLYITNNNTKTTVGLTNKKKTTPSLVVTCGNTTYYGSLTTCAAWATTPNKIVVTSGSTTYYTMSPAKGNKFVNFIIPRECPSVEGAVMAKCCIGIAGSKDYNKNTVRIESLTGHGSLGQATLQAPNSGLVKALLYDSPDTTISHYDIITPKRSHTHDTSIVFDDNFTYDSQLIITTRHKGVRVCNNYQTAPNFIYVGCKNNGMGNLRYDYLCINGTTNNNSRSIAYAMFCFNNTTVSGNTSEDTISAVFAITYTSMAAGPIQTRVGCGDDHYIYPAYDVRHSHHPNPYSGSHMAMSCYNEGYTIPWFGVNMMCYDNDIDKLPSNTLLFTDYPIECFDQRCWELDYDNNNWDAYPFVNGSTYGNLHENEVKMFCWKPNDYDGVFSRHNSNIDVSYLGMWPDSCNGSVENCTYRPILDLEHAHPSPGNTLYFCAKTHSEKGLGVALASPGRYVIRHK